MYLKKQGVEEGDTVSPREVKTSFLFKVWGSIEHEPCFLRCKSFKAKILLKILYMVGICKLEVMGTITW